MGGDKIKMAMQSAYAFALVLEQLKIPYEIFGFSTEGSNTQMGQEYGKFIKGLDPEIVGKIVNANCPETIYAFKQFHQPLDLLAKQCMIGAAKGATRKQNNEDSKHVRLALQRLSARPEKVKSLFVFSDGQPAFPALGGSYKNSYDNLTYYSKNAKAKFGVDIYSVGIMNDSVKLFYKNWKLVKQLSELPTALFDFLKKAI
jgi:cobalamin biosynthesis protein CobT